MADLCNVFEIGPVFRAEDSFTHRHLCEFTGLDLEMVFYEHYHEVLDVLDALFHHVFVGLETKFAKEIEIVKSQYTIEPLLHVYPSPRIPFATAVKWLREAGQEMGDEDDFNTEKERVLGKIVKEKYKTEFYIVDQFPLKVRPFYTMPNATDSRYSNSYDFFIRGEEVMSGAQRVHDANLLVDRAQSLGVNVKELKDYIDAFRYGAMPHGGGGIGLERVIMLYLGVKNIRMTSMFPRDPHRLSP